jgi:YidC/Oxa1 family membrane protein insertase
MPNTMAPQQRYMFLALPFLFVIFVIRFPVGLMLYWITTNLWTVGQQFTLRKLMPVPVLADTPAPAKGGSKGGGGNRPKGGGSQGKGDGGGNGATPKGKTPKGGGSTNGRAPRQPRRPAPTRPKT